MGLVDGAARILRSSYTGAPDAAGHPTFAEGSGDLDACNGRRGDDGVYRYHCTAELVGDDVAPRYPYVLGAYRGEPWRAA